MSSSPRLLLLGGLLAMTGAGCADLERGDPLPDAAAADAAVAPGDGAAAGDGTAARSFARDVFPLLVDRCASCHSSSGQAGDSDLVLGDDAAAALIQVQKIIDLQAPADSRLLSKGTGSGHGGGAAIAAGGPEYTVILEWISQGGAP
jgi:hypothetical protein